MRDSEYSRIAIEFPIDRDSLRSVTAIPQPYFDQASWIADTLKSRDVELWLSLYIYNRERFTMEMQANPEEAIQIYINELARLLNAFGGVKVGKVVIGKMPNEWEAKFSSEQVRRSVKQLRDMSEAPLSYCVDVDRVRLFSEWEDFDEVAVSYPPAPEEEQIPYNRTWNKDVGAAADSLGKSILIWHSNLIGDYKTTQLKNHLRFWPENVVISGLNLNTVYHEITPLDDNPYFGWKEKEELQQVVNEIENKEE